MTPAPLPLRHREHAETAARLLPVHLAATLAPFAHLRASRTDDYPGDRIALRDALDCWLLITPSASARAYAAEVRTLVDETPGYAEVLAPRLYLRREDRDRDAEARDFRILAEARLL